MSSMQGWRISMEDAHACILDLREESKEPGDESRPTSGKISFFGVYDGHGGERVALYAGSNVHGIVASQDAFRNGNYEQALKDGFLATDRAILSS